MVFGDGSNALVFAKDGVNIVVDHVCFGYIGEEFVVDLARVLQPGELLNDDLIEDWLFLGEDRLCRGEVHRLVAGLRS